MSTPIEIKPEEIEKKFSACCGGSKQYDIISPDEIRTQVQVYYADRALNAKSCCSGDPGGEALYNPDLLEDLPKDISDFSLGCGDPITLAHLQEGETVLDLGSGGGLDCFLAARQVGPGGNVIGIDMTSEMLSRACLAAERLGLSNVEFRQGYLESMPVESAGVDVVISNCVINLSPDKSKVFAEMFRVLKPGGRVSLSDIVANGELPEAVKKSMEAWGACIAGALQRDEYIRGLQDAGFVDVRIHAKDDSGVVLDKLPTKTLFSGAITARKP
jgi:SAM-dependent methyltransferase